MSILNHRKLRKLARDPKLFFADALQNKKLTYERFAKKLKPKKKNGYAKYVVVSAVYNVEKYLDDYFKSIINQRLDFKKNIHIILVDDGSTDTSAKIIKNYQKKYPKNITYIYKENGGQASARNLGLKYIKENFKDKFEWVTFTDPDDFLDRDYFYEVDEFLDKKSDDSISMVACNIIFYFEKDNIFKDTHSLKFKFEKDITLLDNSNLNKFIQLSAPTAFFKIENILRETEIPILFQEEIPNFEDAYFVNLILIQNLNDKSAFLKNAIYYYRKRSDATSTLDNVDNSRKKQLIKQGYLLLLLLLNERLHTKIPIFTQQTILYDLIWFLKDNINKRNFDFLPPSQKDELFYTLEQIYQKIDNKLILDFNLAGSWFYHKVGILNCFKHEYPPFQISYIEEFDTAKEQIKLCYFTPDKDDIESIRIDSVEIYADTEKITQHDLLDRVFIYEKILWFHIPKNSKNLEFFVRGKKARITFDKKQYLNLDLKLIYNKFKALKKQDNLWMFMDRDIDADDNAEHLYRYIAKNHPNQKIAYILKKESKDYERLKNEGFNLVDFESIEFKRLAYKSSKIISSHADNYFLQYFKGADFVFLQHGVTKDDVSSWFNQRPIKLFITASKAEYDSIALNFNHYKFSKKDTVLTGFARHDALLKSVNTKKQILIMPTWRKSLVGFIANTHKKDYKEDFKDSEYFIKWQGFLSSENLRNISQKYGYEIVFYPHPNMILYLQDFNLPEFITIAAQNESYQNLFKSSSLMITDYSSVAFEMGYLRKPVIYYQFDEGEIFNNSHVYIKGYFDYKRDGFGPVVTTQEELLIELENLVKNNCQVDEPYKTNLQNTFAFRDGKCCERIYQAILELDKPYENQISLEYVRKKADDALKNEYFYESSCRFRYILENSENIEINDARKYIYSALKSNNGYKASKFLLSIQDKLALDAQIKIEIIKGILSINQNTKEEIEWVLNNLENLKVNDDEALSLMWTKLRIYIYLEKRDKIKETINTLKTKFNVSKDDIDLELYLLRNSILAASEIGGGVEFFI